MIYGDGGTTMSRPAQAQAESEEIRINRRNAADAILDRLEEVKDSIEDAFRNAKRNSLRSLWLTSYGGIDVGMTAEIRDLLEAE